MASRSDIRAGRAFIELYVRNSALVKGLNAAKKNLQDFGRSLTALGTSMLRISAVAAAPIALATRTFAAFDDKMRQVKAVSQATAEGFAALTTKAKALGASTSFTAVQVAGLMAELGRAGFDPKQIEAMTGAVLDLARATSTDATVASGIMAATIRQFNLSAEDATRVADGLTTAANKSFNTVEQLGDALSYAGPVAADFGMSLEEALAVLGTLGNVGIQASNAGTTVRRLLTMSGAEAQKLKGIFGVEFADAAGNARPLVDVLEEVNEATKNLGSAERAKKFNEAFGLLGITGASALSKTAGSTRELLKAIQEAGGAASVTAKEMDAGIGGAFRIMLSAAEGVAIAVGEALNDSMQDAAERVTRVANAVNTFVSNNRQLIVTAVKVAAGFAAVGGALVVAGAVLSGLGATLGAVATALTTAAAIVGFLLSPLGLLIGLVTAGVVAWAKFTTSGQNAMRGIQNALGPMLETVKTTIGAIGEAILAGDWERAGQIAIKGLQIAMLQGLASLADSLGGTLGDAVGHIGATLLKGDLAGAWNAVVTYMGTLWADFAEGMVAVFTLSARAVADIWQGTVNRITDFIFDNPLVSKLALMGTGIDMGQLQADRDRMNAQLGLGPENVRDEAKAAARQQTAATADAARTWLNDLDRSMQEQSDAIGQEFRSQIGGGAERASEEAQRLAAELEELRRQAAEARQASQAAGGGGGAAEGGGTGGQAAMDELTKSATATFSAAGALALGFGGGAAPGERIARGVERLVAKQDEVIAAQKESGKALSGIAAKLLLQT